MICKVQSVMSREVEDTKILLVSAHYSFDCGVFSRPVLEVIIIHFSTSSSSFS